MGRVLRLRQIGMFALLAAQAACYALPERHSLSRESSAVDAGSEGDADGELDGEARLDGGAPGDGGRRDAANPCRCSGDQICIEATKACVDCTATESTCTADEVCDVLRGECVECLQNTDCKDPSASVCDGASHTCQPCTESSASDCSHIAGKQVCLTGQCVQCTKDKLAACAVQQSSNTVQNACHALDHTCTDYELRKTPPCGECVSDAQCMAGHVCVEMAFGGQPIAGKWYCQPVREGLNCTDKQPYVSLAANKRSVDGVTQDVCTLAVTTCGALGQYRNTFCGLDAFDEPIAVSDAGLPMQPSVKGDNARCGLPGLDDGFCVEAQPGDHRCTLPCGSDARDCHVDAPGCAPTTHATGMRQLCTFP